MTWGIGFVRQLLEAAGGAVVMPVVKAPSPAESDETIQITFGYGPMVEGHETVASRRRETVVFLDSTANVMSELLSGGTDPVLAARTMTATLAPLGPILSEKQVLPWTEPWPPTCRRHGEQLRHSFPWHCRYRPAHHRPLRRPRPCQAFRLKARLSVCTDKRSCRYRILLPASPPGRSFGRWLASILATISASWLPGFRRDRQRTGALLRAIFSPATRRVAGRHSDGCRGKRA